MKRRARKDIAERLLAGPVVWIGLVVLTAFALVLDWVVGRAEKHLMKWQPRAGETEKL